jgi:hypothetical protein
LIRQFLALAAYLNGFFSGLFEAGAEPVGRGESSAWVDAASRTSRAGKHEKLKADTIGSLR